jgi:hypothetical protein
VLYFGKLGTHLDITLSATEVHESRSSMVPKKVSTLPSTSIFEITFFPRESVVNFIRLGRGRLSGVRAEEIAFATDALEYSQVIKARILILAPNFCIYP